MNINEGLSDILYHFTYFGSLMNILRQNEFHASTNIGSSADLNTSAGKFFFFSTTRSRGAEGSGAGFGRRSVKLVLDGRKLHQKYKGFPIDFWQYSTKQSDWGDVNNYVASMKNQELEDRIVLDSPTIPNAASYILEIHIMVGKGSEVRKDELDSLMAYVKQYNIPIYFYTDKMGYFNQVKGKAVDPYAVYGFTDEEPYVSASDRDKLWGVDRVLYLLMHNDEGNKSKILDSFKFNDEEMGKFESGYKKEVYNYLMPNALYDYEYNSVISSEVHNMRSKTEPKYKFVMKMLADDLRKHKVNNLKEYINVKTKAKGNKLNEQITRMRKVMGLNEATVDSSGNLMGLESNIFDEFPDEILKTLEDEYGHIYAHNFDWNSKSREFTSDDPNKAYDAPAFNKWVEKNKQVEFLKNLDKIISAIRSDLLLKKRIKLAEMKLKAFEELIIPVFGKHITGDVLTKFEESVLMDFDATPESIRRGFEEAKNIIDQYGNIDSSKIEKSMLFTGGDINIPNFERFVEANPEYRKTFDSWSRLHDAYSDLYMTKLNAFRGYTYKPLRDLYDYLIMYKKKKH